MGNTPFPTLNSPTRGHHWRGERCTPIYFYLIPSSKTPLVEGYVTIMAARSLLCFSAWWNKHQVSYLDIKKATLFVAGISLTIWAGGQLVFTGGQSFLNWTFLYENVLLLMVKAGSQLCQFAQCLAFNEFPAADSFATKKHKQLDIKMTRLNIWWHRLS